MSDELEVQAPATENPAPVADQAPANVNANSEKPAGELALDATPDAEKAIAPDWREDWREKMAGGDAKELARLQRFKSPIDVYKSARELERKMSSGEVKAKLAADATPEQIAAWRKDNGIPEKPDGYLEKLPKGLVIGDADKPLIEGFLASVHGKNAPPEVVAEAIDWYYKAQEDAIAARVTADQTFAQASTDALRAEWGGEFRANINSITAFLDAAPVADDGTPLKGLLMDARLGDGTRLGDNPAALKWLAGLAAEANPAGFVAPGASQIEGVQTELEKIADFRRNDRAAYFKDEKMQARERQLIAAKDKLSSR